jgi:hypothetical protein
MAKRRYETNLVVCDYHETGRSLGFSTISTEASAKIPSTFSKYSCLATDTHPAASLELSDNVFGDHEPDDNDYLMMDDVFLNPPSPIDEGEPEREVQSDEDGDEDGGNGGSENDSGIVSDEEDVIEEDSSDGSMDVEDTSEDEELAAEIHDDAHLRSLSSITHTLYV